MHFSTIALLATCLVVGVIASPIASPFASKSADWKFARGWDGTAISVGTANTTGIEKRTPGGVFICDQLNWTGRCGYAVQRLNECIQLGSDWIFQISSFGPDANALCVAFSNNGCRVILGV
ncbi:hypothetical protein GGX14DRAFT_563778 [Mycena pura]|uniref:Uncharacterized protein n=1 Tax=Mycena pura TaxID=153505 RepID=A0AAD6VHW7_9AGAR|nr:hypothetical protein GGX14DRAFT_563778 [Mycena pura]